MCGFVGFARFKEGPGIEARQLERAGAAIGHRGPDDDGIFLLPWLGLAHRRLSILDPTEAAHQPMRDPSGRYVIVFNGEIYNHRELSARFLGDAAWVNRASDTSVLLGLFLKLGPACLDHLNGMFAFGIIDLQEHTLFLARDRFGEKPLCWLSTRDGFAFASEMQALRALGLDFPWRLDPLSLALFHMAGSVPPPRTIYRDVRFLPPGCSLTVDARGRVAQQTYWAVPPLLAGEGERIRSREEAVARCREALVGAVESRMLSDVPVGIFLSGGLDSSAILALHAHLGLPPMDALCIDFAEARFSEYALAETTARTFGARMHRREVTPEDFLGRLDGFFRACDQPTTDGFNTYFVSGFGAELGIKVWLSGVGGDEVFGGYPSFRRLGPLRGASRFLQALMPAWVADRAAKAWPERPRFSRLAQLGDPGDPVKRAYQGLRNIVPWRNARGVMSAGLWERAWRLPEALDDLYPDLPPGAAGFDHASAMELRMYMASQLLRDMDNVSMAHSIELRAPFLDHRLVELVFACPLEAKQRRGARKPLLLDALPLPLPEVVTAQPKRGFGFPLEIWMREHLRATFPEVVLSSARQDLWNLEAVGAIWAGYLAGRVHWSLPWTFYALARWMHAHDESV